MKRRRMRGVEHTGEWEWEGGSLGMFVGQYRDANGVAWNVAEVLGEWSAQTRAGKETSHYDVGNATAGSKEELQRKIDAIADRAWDRQLRTESAKKSGGGGAVLLLAALAFGGKKKRGRRRR